MTQEEKQLLLCDLSTKLSYGVICLVQHKDGRGWVLENLHLDGYTAGKFFFKEGIYSQPENIKPYLRRMSSMTEEEKKEYYTFQYKFTLQTYEYQELNKETFSEYLNWLNKHYFDYRGLIEKGLALAAPEGMYKSI